MKVLITPFYQRFLLHIKTRLGCLFLLTIMAFNTLHAQVILPPAEPNEVCKEAWNNYRKADILWKTGWGLFGGGIVTVPVAAFFGVVTTPKQRSYHQVNTDPTTIAINSLCWSLCGIGSASVVASIPCLAVGQVQRKAAIRSYNEWNCSPETCKDIQVNYQKANTLWKTGWGLFGGGMGLTTIGALLVGIDKHSWSHPNGPAMQNAGDVLIVVGSGSVIASIPCIAVGQVRRQASRNLYNNQCTDQPPLTFSIYSSSNGLGLAMQF